MKKLLSISIISNFKIQCTFENKEIRVFDLEKSLDISNKYVKNIFDPTIFNQASIGEMGELKWENQAEIRALDGTVIACAYDVCPDFIYLESEPLQEQEVIN